MTNFGVELFLKRFLQLARSPTGRAAVIDVLPSLSSSLPSLQASVQIPIVAIVSAVPAVSTELLPTLLTSQDAAPSLLVQQNSMQPPQQQQNSNGAKSQTKQIQSIIEPDDNEFSGFVFKLQANLDPRHRDRMAFIRICSGVFHKGMKVNHSRMRKSINLSSAQSLFAQERESITEAFPGDVIGVHNPGLFAIGDTIYTGPARISYPGIPSFSPEKFSYIRNPNPSLYKKFQKVRTGYRYIALE